MTDNPSNNKFSNIIEKFRNNKKLRYIIVGILFLIVIFILIGNKPFTNQTNTETNSIETYVENLENKLTNTLSKVKGAGKVEVIITIDSGMETILASKITTTETPSGIERVETPILVNGKTVVIKELYPKISGVLIVAEGASNLAVMNRLQQATVSLLDININQIEILSMN